ncbi:MAG: S-layer homology domain-containing protein [Oscillospiraceae bacterium]|nr:S-layer homology domain-containing protein [Oscillospiraceae bacterium]
MKKRFFAALLCICLVLTLAPAAAQADYAPNPVTIYATIDGQPLKNASISVDIYWFMGNQGIKLDRTEACQTDSSGEALVYVTGKSTGGATIYMFGVSYQNGLYVSKYQDNAVTILSENESKWLETKLVPTKGKLTVKNTYGPQSHVTADSALASQSFTITGPDNYFKAVTLDSSNNFSFTTDFLTSGNYTVTEKPSIAGYNVAVKIDGAAASADAAGNYSRTVAVDALGRNIKFENTFTSTTPVGSLRITKAFGSGSAVTSGVFDFSVTGDNNYSTTFTLDSSNSYTKVLTLLKPGQYTVTELSPATVFEGSPYLLTVSANSNGAGAQAISPVSGSYSCEVAVAGNQAASAAFTNTYVQAATVKVTVWGDNYEGQPVRLEKTGARYEGITVNRDWWASNASADLYATPGECTVYIIPLKRAGYAVTVEGGVSYDKAVLYPDAEGKYGLPVTASLSAATEVNFFLTYTDNSPAAPSCGFSFSGANAGKLMGSTAKMEYSLDGGTAWVDCTADTALPVGSISDANDIRVRLKATGTVAAGKIQTIDITRAATPALTVTQPAVINGTGSINTGVAHEYKAASSAAWISATGVTSGLPAGKYEVRVKAAGQALASAAQQLTVTAFVPAAESAPSAVFTATGADSGTLSNVSAGLKYSTDGRSWTDIPSAADIALTGLSVGTLHVVKKGNGTTTVDSAPQAIDITRAATPALTVTQPAVINGTGSINTGVAHEYRAASSAAWISATGVTSGLPAGKYEVRVKAAAQALASAAQELTVTAFVPPSPPVPDTAKNYTLSFETNGGSAVPSVSRKENTAVDLTLSMYSSTREGHSFAGWYSDSALKNRVTSITLTKNTTVYAGWSSSSVPSATPEEPFTDVSPQDQFYGDIIFVSGCGLMTGDGGTTFGPNEPATRAAAAAAIWRMEGEPEAAGKNGFTDVEEGEWYAEAVGWAAENGIAGDGGGLFRPDAPATREQLALFFYNYAAYKGYDTSVAGSLDAFSDTGEVSAQARDAVSWAVGAGLITGGGTLDPQRGATRAELAAMLHRFIEKYELVEGVAPGGLTGWVLQADAPASDGAAGVVWPVVLVAAALALVVFSLLRLKRRSGTGGRRNPAAK